MTEVAVIGGPEGVGGPEGYGGEVVRPLQGIASLDFPIYAAAWYDNKELGIVIMLLGGGRGVVVLSGLE
jgi:hypothetical protein